MNTVLLLLHILFLGLVLAGVVWTCRWIFRRSRLLGVVVCLGVSLRLISGCVLFAVSYWNSDFLAHAHTGDGFWALAPDARVYYELAARVAADGLAAVPRSSPSPFYLAVLGLWLRASGVFILNAILFNVLCYVATFLAIVCSLPRDSSEMASPSDANLGSRAFLLSLVGLTFSPILLLTSTQVLKDPFFALLIVLACVGALRILELLRGRSPGMIRATITWTLLAAVAQYGLAGTRTYYALFVWIAYAGGFFVLLWLVPRQRAANVLASSVAILSILWVAIMVGAGPYYVYYAELARHATGLSIPFITAPRPTVPPAMPMSEPDLSTLGVSVPNLRRGFIRAGGTTNLVGVEREGQSRLSATGVLRDVAGGLAAMFVPISILQWMSIVSFQGGRGFLVVTDLDTFFIDLTMGAVCVLMYRHRALFARRAPHAVFSALLIVLCAVLLAYIVTNFGTLFRLRLLAVVPAWLAPLAVAARQRDAVTLEPCAE